MAGFLFIEVTLARVNCIEARKACEHFGDFHVPIVRYVGKYPKISFIIDYLTQICDTDSRFGIALYQSYRDPIKIAQWVNLLLDSVTPLQTVEEIVDFISSTEYFGIGIFEYMGSGLFMISTHALLSLL